MGGQEGGCVGAWVSERASRLGWDETTPDANRHPTAPEPLALRLSPLASGAGPLRELVAGGAAAHGRRRGAPLPPALARLALRVGSGGRRLTAVGQGAADGAAPCPLTPAPRLFQ